MATYSQIWEALARADLFASFMIGDDGIRYGGQSEYNITSVSIVGWSYWSYDQMRNVAKALQTDHINVEDAGCETCGYGSSLNVRGIPHPFTPMEGE